MKTNTDNIQLGDYTLKEWEQRADLSAQTKQKPVNKKTAGFKKSEPDVFYNTSPVKQLKFDFNLTLKDNEILYEIVSKIVNGELRLQTKDDIESILSRVEDSNQTINADSIKNLLETINNGINILKEYDIELLLSILEEGDIKSLENVIRKEISAVKVLKALAVTGKSESIYFSFKEKERLIEAIKNINNYVNYIKNTLQINGNIQIEHKNNEFLPVLNSTSQLKAGIKIFSQSFINEVKEILKQQEKLDSKTVYQQALNKLTKKESAKDFTSFLLKPNNKFYSDLFQKLPENPLKLDYQSLIEIITESIYSFKYDLMLQTARLAPDKTSFYKTIANWCDFKEHTQPNYVHNLLSGIDFTKNCSNTGFFTAPFKLISNTEEYLTYKCMLESWIESWILLKETFLIRSDKNNFVLNQSIFNKKESTFKLDESYFNDLNAFWDCMELFHTILAQKIGVNNEFIEQLNYRAIVKSKSLQTAQAIIDKSLMNNNEIWIDEEANKLFKTKFNPSKTALDSESLNQAKKTLHHSKNAINIYNLKPKSTSNSTFLNQKNPTLEPFKKCMLSIVKTALDILQNPDEYSALYIAASPLNRILLKSHTIEGEQARLRCAFGMFSVSLCTLMAFNGLITGMEPFDGNSGSSKLLYSLGWKPYSYRKNCEYITYKGNKIAEFILGFGADCANIYSSIQNISDKTKTEYFQSQILTVLVNKFIDKSEFENMLCILDKMINPSDETGWERYSYNKISTNESFYEKILCEYFPKNTELEEYRRNVFGEKQSITDLISLSLRLNEPRAEDKALEYLAKYGYSPDEIDEVLNIEGILKDKVLKEMSEIKIQGLSLREALRIKTLDEEYNLLPDGVNFYTLKRSNWDYETKINTINDIFLMYKQKALKNVLLSSKKD